MLQRFQGKDGRATLMNALRSQCLVQGNSEISEKLSSVIQLKEFLPEAVLFAEGDRSSELNFILTGRVSVRRCGQEIAILSAGKHVGEIALLEPFKGRSRTVIAIDTVVVAQVSAQRFTAIASNYPDLWRRMAIELAHRLVDTTVMA